MVDKYSWVDVGSSYLPCDIQAAYLWGQLEMAQEINQNRLQSWSYYFSALKPLIKHGEIELPFVPKGCVHNAHMFYLKVRDLEERTALLKYLRDNNILAVFHYVPLHTSVAGPQFSRFHGFDNYTTKESERLIRLPLWYGIDGVVTQRVVDAIGEFFK